MKNCAAKWQWVSLGLMAAGSLSGCAVHRSATPDREWWGPGLRRGPIASAPACDCATGAVPETAPSTLPPPLPPPAPFDAVPSTVPDAIPPAPMNDVIPQRETSVEEVPLPPPPPPRQGAFSQFRSRLFPRRAETPPFSAGRNVGGSRVANIDDDIRSERRNSRVRPVQYDSGEEGSHDEAESAFGEPAIREKALVRDRTHQRPHLDEIEGTPFEPRGSSDTLPQSQLLRDFDNSAEPEEKVEPWPYHGVKSSLDGYSPADNAEQPPAYPHAPAPRPRSAVPVELPLPRDAAGSATPLASSSQVRGEEELEPPQFENEAPSDERQQQQETRGVNLPGKLEFESEEDEVPAGKVQGLFPLPTIEPGPSYQRHRRRI